MRLENPFEAHTDQHFNACVSNYLRYWELGDHYLQAADALIQAAVDDHSLLDVHIYPISFLYRQALELMIKDPLWMSHYLAHGKKILSTLHGLSDLWHGIKTNCGAIPHFSFPLKARETKMLERLFEQIEKHDPGSDAFRYPFDRGGKISHPSLRNVNVRVLYERVHHARDLLSNLRESVDEAYNWSNEH